MDYSSRRRVHQKRGMIYAGAGGSPLKGAGGPPFRGDLRHLSRSPRFTGTLPARPPFTEKGNKGAPLLLPTSKLRVYSWDFVCLDKRNSKKISLVISQASLCDRRSFSIKNKRVSNEIPIFSNCFL